MHIGSTKSSALKNFKALWPACVIWPSPFESKMEKISYTWRSKPLVSEHESVDWKAESQLLFSIDDRMWRSWKPNATASRLAEGWKEEGDRKSSCGLRLLQEGRTHYCWSAWTHSIAGCLGAWAKLITKHCSSFPTNATACCTGHWPVWLRSELRIIDFLLLPLVWTVWNDWCRSALKNRFKRSKPKRDENLFCELSAW